jgi:16S rRNA G1207 methylase RsmC
MKADSDYQFSVSLLPFLKRVPIQRKMAVRHKLQQVFIDEDEVALRTSQSPSTYTSTPSPASFTSEPSHQRQSKFEVGTQLLLHHLPDDLTPSVLPFGQHPTNEPNPAHSNAPFVNNGL